MTTLFITCITIGGTILAVQFALTLLGFLDFGGELVDDLGADSVDSIDGVDSIDDLHGGHGEVTHDAASSAGHAHDHFAASFAWLWSVLSFRNLTAGVTFFGLTGMAARGFGATPVLQVTTATIAGLTAMYSLHWLMRSIFRLARDSTLQVRRAIGATGTVYLSIPAAKTGRGKVHVTVQGRLEEFDAVTPAPDKLVVGAKVVVIDIVDGETLAVVPADIDAELSRKIASMA